MYRLREERLRSLHSPEPSPLPKGIFCAPNKIYLVDAENLKKRERYAPGNTQAATYICKWSPIVLGMASEEI